MTSSTTPHASIRIGDKTSAIRRDTIGSTVSDAHRAAIRQRDRATSRPRQIGGGKKYIVDRARGVDLRAHEVELRIGYVQRRSDAARVAQNRQIICFAGFGDRLAPRVEERARRDRRRRDDGLLLLLPGAAWSLVVPARLRTTFDPATREGLADIRFPFGMAVGFGDFRVQRVAIAIVLGNQALD